MDYVDATAAKIVLAASEGDSIRRMAPRAGLLQSLSDDLHPALKMIGDEYDVEYDIDGPDDRQPS